MQTLIANLEKDINDILNDGYKICLTIGLTSSSEKNYLTPIRTTGKIKILGCVVNNTAIAEEITKKFMDNVSYFFIDIEKKLSPKIIGGKLDSRNIFHPILEITGSEKVFPYKPNDLTIDAIYERVTSFILHKKNLKVCVIGLGNIGSKISLKLVESGMDVIGVPRLISYKEKNIESAINSIKPDGAIAKFIIEDNLIKALMATDIVLCCATAKNLININHESLLKDKHLILDIGKKNVDFRLTKKISGIEWLDVGESLKKYISAKIEEKIESRKVKKTDSNIVQAGSLAVPGNVICSNLSSKKIDFYGKIDSSGTFKRFTYKKSLLFKKQKKN